MNKIADYIEYNVDEVREDVVKMVAGIDVTAELMGYSATEQQRFLPMMKFYLQWSYMFFFLPQRLS